MELSYKEQTEFEKVREDLFDGDDNFRRFCDALLQTPRAGAVIPGTNGARKVRWADPMRGKGKRGGLRVIYFYHEARLQILLLLAYDKNTADLTAQERKEIAAAIEAFRQEAEQGKTNENRSH